MSKNSVGEEYKNRNDKSELGLKSLKDYNAAGSSNETRVLSQMCNCIKSNETRLNGHIRRMFSLDEVLVDTNDVNQSFLPHEEMMERLRPYDNLIKSIGALQYTTKYMQNQVPIIFRAWKEMVFEKKAKRLHVMLSSGSVNTSELDNQFGNHMVNISGIEVNN
jgi:hypothetical protein